MIQQYIPVLKNQIFVNSIYDLPEPAVGGFITLEDNTLYEFAPGLLDLGTSKLICPQNCVLRGQGTFTSLISSNITSGETFITSANPGGILHIEGLQFNFNNLNFTVFDIDGLEQLLVTSSFFIGEGNIGRIANVNTSRFGALCSLVGFSSGLELDGAFGTVFFDRTGFVNIGSSPAPKYVYTLPTTTIGLWMSFAGCRFIVPSGTIGIDIDPATTITLGSHKVEIIGNSFDLGGTALSGITPNNSNLFSRANFGIQDSRAYGKYRITTPSATNFTSVGVPVKANGQTTLSGGTARGFTHNDNQLTYDVPTPIQVKISASAYVTPTNPLTTAVTLYIAKNGVVDADSEARVYLHPEGSFVATASILDAVSTDYFEIWVANETDTNPVTLESKLTQLDIIAL